MMTDTTQKDGTTATHSVVSLDVARGRPAYQVPHSTAPKPRQREQQPATVVELGSLCRAQDSRLKQLEILMFEAKVALQALERCIDLCLSDLTPVYGEDIAKQHITDVLDKGFSR